MNRRVLVSVILGALLGAVIVVATRPTYASGMGDSVGLLQFTVHDRGATPTASIEKELNNMAAELNSAERLGYRVKGYAINAAAGVTEHFFVMEKAK